MRLSESTAATRTPLPRRVRDSKGRERERGGGDCMRCPCVPPQNTRSSAASLSLSLSLPERRTSLSLARRERSSTLAFYSRFAHPSLLSSFALFLPPASPSDSLSPAKQEERWQDSTQSETKHKQTQTDIHTLTLPIIIIIISCASLAIMRRMGGRKRETDLPVACFDSTFAPFSLPSFCFSRQLDCERRNQEITGETRF